MMKLAFFFLAAFLVGTNGQLYAKSDAESVSIAQAATGLIPQGSAVSAFPCDPPLYWIWYCSFPQNFNKPKCKCLNQWVQNCMPTWKNQLCRCACFCNWNKP